MSIEETKENWKETRSNKSKRSTELYLIYLFNKKLKQLPER